MVRDWATYMVPAGMSLRIVSSHNSVPSLYKSRSEIHSYKKRAFLIYESQQDAQVTEFILSDNCSTCLGVTITHLQEHKKTVTTASGNRYTVLFSAAIVEELEPVTVVLCS
jgi:hypothetical protein